MVWENVPGAFSSNKGEDFQIVLEETAKVADKDAVIPMPDKGKWTTSGCIMGDGWSIAWRILDAQFWGVPQRRRKIALVADFGGQSASEILFVRKSLSGDTEQSKQERERTSSDAEGSTGADDCKVAIGCDIYGLAVTGDTAVILTTQSNATGSGPRVIVPYTLKIRSGCEGGGKGALIQTDKSATLSTLQDQTLFQPVVCLDRSAYNQGKNAKFDIGVDEDGTAFSCIAKGPGAVAYGINGDKAGTLDSSYYKGCGMRQGAERDVIAQPILLESNQNHATVQTDGICTTLPASMGMGGGYVPMVSTTHHIVRRLTPLECERLQGFPDGWTDIGDWVDSKGKAKKTSDAARYKALGNSIAIPPWKWVMKRLCACYERDATMASLFDGIGGFPLIWEQINGKGSCLWASEIEEFPIAVTKARFGECTY